jgi:hypothetical protein
MSPDIGSMEFVVRMMGVAIVMWAIFIGCVALIVRLIRPKRPPVAASKLN